ARGWVAAVAVCAAACGGGPAGLRHRVERGETLYRIGKAYGVSYQELARVNHLANPDRIEVGQEIVIPHASRELPVQMITPDAARADRPALPELPSGPAPFVWPVAGGVLSSDFGPRGETHHDGIDISTPEGTPVHAARAGRVLYADRLRGYGNLVIVEHGDGYATVYAHNRENKAHVGDDVRQGDVIASVGRTGTTSGPNLHFEIRKDNVARNPLFYLPAASTARAVQAANVVEGTP
ncbi:MAG TPA: LysM peptidoglycan-binding domain-containing M23 family metallopeptidase, partial [Candidatus Binatia bacterium]|nr:LysM peptidoglycan-binding domain-containing M23 family metallopeptidase [Candidatus Binatia bacterium]